MVHVILMVEARSGKQYLPSFSTERVEFGENHAVTDRKSELIVCAERFRKDGKGHSVPVY